MGKRAAHIWTAAETRYAQEQRAAHHVERQGFEFYLPETLALTRRGSERRELLFPGYIFIRVTSAWRSLMGTRGISRLITWGEAPSRIPDEEIEEIKSREDAAGFVRLLPPLPEGCSVEADETGGAYSGMKGIYEGMSARNRCIVLLGILGRQVRVELDRRSLSPAP